MKISSQNPFLDRKTELPGERAMISKPVLLLFGTVTNCSESGPSVDSIPPKAAGLRSCFLVTKLKRGDEAKTNSTGS